MRSGTDTDVIVVGAGPAGAMLAGELRLAGAECVVLDEGTGAAARSRPLDLSARALEVLDQRGLLPRLGPLGVAGSGSFGGIPLDYRELEGGSAGARGVSRPEAVAALTAWARELGADLRRGWRATGFAAGRDAVEVTAVVRGGARLLRAAYLVRCDGRRGTLREGGAVPYRHGRVFAAGGAAGSRQDRGAGWGADPGGAGVEDAVNLGWKLAAAVHGWAPAGLLDTYPGERQPARARALATALAGHTLRTGGERTRPVAEVLAGLAALRRPREHLIGRATGLDVRYDVGPGDHPLLGRRLPNRELVDESGTVPFATTSEMLRTARGVVLDMAGDAGVRAAAAAWSGRVDTVCATPLPVAVPDTLGGAEVLLVRPDGHVAWVGTTQDRSGWLAEGHARRLTAALTRWFGEPAVVPAADAGGEGRRTGRGVGAVPYR